MYEDEADLSPKKYLFDECRKTAFNARLEKEMALSPNVTAEILKKHGLHEKDSGSPQVQIALMTHKLNYLNDHFKAHTKDHHSRTGLMRLVGQRRRLLDYLHKSNPTAYKDLIGQLGIRK